MQLKTVIIQLLLEQIVSRTEGPIIYITLIEQKINTINLNE